MLRYLFKLYKEIQANQGIEKGGSKETKSDKIFLVYEGLMVGGN